MDPGNCLFVILQGSASILNPDFTFTAGFVIECLVLLSLLLASGYVSGAETAFFAISPAQLQQLKESNSGRSRIVYSLLEKPKRLLASLLISMNFINIGIVVLSTLIINNIFVFHTRPVIGFLIQVVAVTFVIVLFCEVMPKVYATQNALRSALRSAYGIFIIDKILTPLSALLVRSTSIVEKRIGTKGYDVSVDELTHAIDITSDKSTPEEEKKILKGIARFGNIDVRQIMKPRMDVIGIEKSTAFNEVLELINEHRYSRMPVYESSFDQVIGVLYIKDMIPFLDQKNNPGFDWLKFIRPAYFVPESKKINDLLQEFQEKKNHLAIVIDEYGGSSGIVTLEDILEEIVGEINDEFDEEEIFYSKLDDRNFVFEGKTNLNDISRIMEVDRKIFDSDNETIDTLAGLLLEIRGSIPQRNEVIKLNDLSFTIESADRKRIKRVKITLPENPASANGNGNGNASGALTMLILFVSIALSLTSCEEEFVPKPRGYFRIQLPEKQYVHYSASDCPFEFDRPVYAEVTNDTGRADEKCWKNIEFPQFNGTIYLSYKEVNNDIQKFIDDSRSLTMKHIAKASGMNEETYSNDEKRVYGSYIKVKGNSASSIQFYLTDSTRHFVRGALYFYAVPNADSLKPVSDFIEADVKKMVETFSWK